MQQTPGTEILKRELLELTRQLLPANAEGKSMKELETIQRRISAINFLLCSDTRRICEIN